MSRDPVIPILEGRKQSDFLDALSRRGANDLKDVEPAVRRIVNDVRRNGDRSLRRYATRWDRLPKDGALRVSESEMQEAWERTDLEIKDAIKHAAGNIRRYAEWQKPEEWQREIQSGVCVGQFVRPLQSVGCYAPGGRYPLPSTLLMTVIPAQVAGVKRICVASPNPAHITLAAAKFLGVKEFYRIGGAQAVTAFAYGTQEVQRVDKIVGPGNRYVTAAKKMVAFDCAIEFLAGPTEALIVSENGDPACIASDLVAQAEHDPDATSVLLTTSRALALAVQSEIKERVRENPIASQSLSSRGAILLLSSMAEAIAAANRIAPEHLTVPPELASSICNAGSVFLDEFTPQAAGDYISGPNHVLPTGGMARTRGGLSVLDFVRIIACQQVSRAGMQNIAPAAVTLANAEGLTAHAEAFRVRSINA